MLATLFCDGGARGNPGLAGAAAILFNQAGQALANASHFLGRATNNVAEYQGVLLGLSLAQKHGVSRLSLRLDSELVVRQLQGRYKVRHADLLPLWRECLQGLKAFDHWDVQHIPREQNQDADLLVNQVIDQHTR